MIMANYDNTIKNEMDIYAHDATPYQLPSIEGSQIEVEAEFLQSDSLEEIEGGVSRINAGIDILALVQGLAILKIEREGLFFQAGFKTSAQYFREADARLNMPRQTISQRRQTAEAYLQFRKRLSRTNLSGHVSKLRYLPRAAELHGEGEAVETFKAASVRSFIEYATGEEERPYSLELPAISASINRGRVMIDGKSIAAIDEGLEEEEKTFFIDILRGAYQARKSGLLPHIVPVYSKGEARAIDNFLKKHRAKK